MTNEPDLPISAEDGAVPAIAPAVNHPSPEPTEAPATDYDLRMAAENAAACVAAFDVEMTPAAMREALTRAILCDQQGEAKLQLQAQVLDALFHRTVQKALTAPRWQTGEGHYLDSHGINLALRTQFLCRTTYECLHRLKNTTEKEDA